MLSGLDDKGQSMALAGALGGVVRWLTLRTTWLDGVIAIVVGSICAVYLGPVFAPAVDKFLGDVVIDNMSRAGLSGFVIGIGGVGVSGLVLDVIAYRKKALMLQVHQEDENPHE